MTEQNLEEYFGRMASEAGAELSRLDNLYSMRGTVNEVNYSNVRELFQYVVERTDVGNARIGDQLFEGRDPKLFAMVDRCASKTEPTRYELDFSLKE